MSNNSYNYNHVVNFTNVNTSHKNLDYEEALLSLCLLDELLAGNIIPYLLMEDFTTIENQQCFIVLKTLFDTNNSINDDQVLKLGRDLNYHLITPEFLARLHTTLALPQNISMYLMELVKLTKLRKVDFTVKTIATKLNTEKNISDQDVIDEIQSLLLNLDRSDINKDFLISKVVSDRYHKNLLERAKADANSISGLATGFQEFDELTQGLHPGQFIVLAARPGMGKTAFALNLATNVAKKHRVAFFSLEMSPESLMERIYGFTTGIEIAKLQKPQVLNDTEKLRIRYFKENLIDKLNLFFDDSYNNELSFLLWKCRRLHKIEPLSLIVVDYLQLIPFNSKNGENRQQEITKISRALKTLALELGIPVIALSQLSREVEKRDRKRPVLSDIRESGAIEQDADIVAFLYRDSYYNRNNENKYNGIDVGSPTLLDIAKRRGGATAEIMLKFQMSIGRFSDANLNEDLENGD